jgi:hypothetical protein
VECCRHVSSWPAEWSEFQHSDGLSLPVSVVWIRKKSQGDIWRIWRVRQYGDFVY